jgi:hypothetical protein
MPQWLASLIAALIGASVGSIGAVIASDWRKRKAEMSQRREALVQRYLYQLQDSAVSLWYRLDNLERRNGRLVMDDQYFETTTLYALGRVLAIERLLALEGVYPQLATLYPELGSFLREHRVDDALPRSFYQYDRLALAEAVMEREGDHYRPSTYLEFRRRYESEDSGEGEWLAPARKAIEALGKNTTSNVLDELRTVAHRISRETGIPSGLAEQHRGSAPTAGRRANADTS